MKIATQGGVAVITGAAGGLGSTFANHLAERGYRLLLIDRRQQPLEQVCNLITARHGANVEACACDLSRRDEVEALANRLDQSAREIAKVRAAFDAQDRKEPNNQ